MTNIQLHNTLTDRDEVFRPIDPENVRMYVCGPTVYDRAHVGNARPVVVFDTLFRLLRHVYGAERVTYVRNVTDVDDKIIQAARRNNEAIDALTARTLADFHADMHALGALAPTHEPTATGHIAEMIAMIEELVARGHAYVTDGNVVFEVARDPGYGRLSGRDLSGDRAGHRVAVEDWKRAPEDFVLWKPAAGDEPGWDSPWGRGRPGWHIECSAMARKYLGPAFDIHAGGQDLVFPHHENEIAQSTCCGDRFAHTWLHNGHVMVDGAKMAKSAGNFVTVRDLLDRGHPGEAVRLALLSGHYRGPLDVTDDRLAEARATLDRVYQALRPHAAVQPGAAADTRVIAALADDLNTPAAIAELHRLTQEVNRGAAAPGALQASANLLGLLQHTPQAWFQDGASGDTGWIEARIAERETARRHRDFARADEIRDELRQNGVRLEDGPDGTVWRRT